MIRKKLKEVLSIMMCCLLCFSTFASAAYEETDTGDFIEERYATISSKSCSISISGINSTSKAILKSNSTQSLSIKMELQKIKNGTYTTIETWTTSKTGTTISIEKDRLINVLSTYRLKVTFSAGSETVVSFAYP